FFMKKYLFIIVIACLFVVPLLVNSQEVNIGEEEVLKARVIEVIEQNIVTSEDGSSVIQQKLKLKGLSGNWADKEFIFDGTQYEVISASAYKIGDKVMVSYSPDMEGNDIFYVTDYVRQGKIYWLALLFAIAVIAVGRLKGVRALVVLVLTFLIILGFIIPRILAGNSPLFISIIGSLFILILAIYITEGFKRTSTIAVVSIFISLIITGFLSVWFTALTKLTGFASDEAIYLMGLKGGDINVQGLLLAGIIIGALGVLDDVIISQVTLVRELKQANPHLPIKQLYGKAMKVGVSHMSAMVNTLFLAYAGAALPLLILFSVKEPPFLTLGQVLNNEMIATEIVRTITGSIGLVLAIPIATLLAVHFIRFTGHKESVTNELSTMN
ncbi:YibE/F family protein, partial [Patescibacteria group bacterium]|nr:YibE/F family protein [Patescibacteria group bacterium]